MCNSCEVININGINCHEIGCPNTWQDKARTCQWCGNNFIPETKHQKCCDDSCYTLFDNVRSTDISEVY